MENSLFSEEMENSLFFGWMENSLFFGWIGTHFLILPKKWTWRNPFLQYNHCGIRQLLLCISLGHIMRKNDLFQAKMVIGPNKEPFWFIWQNLKIKIAYVARWKNYILGCQNIIIDTLPTIPSYGAHLSWLLGPILSREDSFNILA